MAWPLNLMTKAEPARSPEDAPVQPQVVYLSGGSAFAIVKWNDTIAAEMAMRHPIVSRAIEKIAASFQQVRWFVEVDPYAPKDEQQNKKRQIAEIQALLDSPNPEMTPGMLRYWMALNYICYGRVPIKVSFSATNQAKPNGIYPLEAKYVHAKPNMRGSIDSYEYGTGENKQSFPSRTAAAKGKSFIEQIWKPGLKGFQHKDDGNTPLNSVGLPAQVIKALLVRSIQAAEGHPNVRYLVTCSKTLTESQKKALKRHLNEDHGIDGPDAGRVPILQNAGDIEIHKLDNDLSDIHSKMPSDDMSRMIFGCFGVPVALVGIGAADAAKFAGNYESSRASFWQDTVIPTYSDPIMQAMTKMLCPPGLRITGDYDSVPALMPARILTMAELEKVKFLTIQEKRELFGWIGPVPKELAPPKETTPPKASQETEPNE